ncbi:uncharacterized protein LOC112589479 [Harpegnathos saltator]|uniref:uncharacterized protein LOC112589479 n=1 Tax=Harpegnathos saltator TaxID=610380 RepID=UPI000DBEEE84|nr:uncharacterized protein LOC112589479 [Harpegnathos saltator]
MKKSIMATLYHYCSTDEKPKHGNCPAGADSWCEWRKAEAAGQLVNYKHPAPVIKSDIEKHLTSIYEDLSNEDLLTRCLGGHTQNSNESFNSTVWRIAPKHLNSGFKIVQIAAYLATGIFNEDYTAILLTMQLLEINIGQQCKMFVDNYDAQRVTRGERRRSSTTKEARTARRLEQMQRDEFYEEAEGLRYGPGTAD